MPDRLKAGLEQLSGIDLSTVRVHYNASEPAQLSARAYTQGRDIYVAPGQEKHLPHEGWHAVQQMQGRVRPMAKFPGVSLNGEPELEHEADLIGARAAQAIERTEIMAPRRGAPQLQQANFNLPIQRKPERQNDGTFKDKKFPGHTLILVRIADGWRHYQSADTTKEFRVNSDDLYEGPVPLLSNPTAYQGLTDPKIPSFGTFLADEELVRLWEVIEVYGAKAVVGTLRAREVAHLRDVGNKDAKEHIRGELGSPYNKLKTIKPMWFGNSGFKGEDKVYFDYIGSIGELMDEFRVQHRARAKNARQWLLRHSKGSSEMGPDIVLIKEKSAGNYSINIHEVKFNTTKNSIPYGYGKDEDDYRNGKEVNSGLPLLYRMNYNKKGNPRPEPTRLLPQFNPQSVDRYLVTRVDEDATIPRDVRKQIVKGLNDKSIPQPKWKYMIIGKGTVQEGLNVQQTKFSQKLQPDKEPVKTWLAAMEEMHTLERINTYKDMLSILAEATPNKDKDKMNKALESLAQVSGGKKGEPKATVDAHDMLTNYYAKLLLAAMDKSIAREQPETANTVHATKENLEAFKDYQTNLTEGIHRGPSLQQEDNYCGQHAAYNALLLHNAETSPGDIVERLLNRSEFGRIVGELRPNIDDNDIRSILDAHQGHDIPILNIDAVDMTMAIFDSLKENVAERDMLINSMLHPRAYRALLNFFTGDSNELTMILQTGAEDEYTIAHFITAKLVRRGNKLSLLYLDSLEGDPYTARLNHLLSVFHNRPVQASGNVTGASPLGMLSHTLVRQQKQGENYSTAAKGGRQRENVLRADNKKMDIECLDTQGSDTNRKATPYSKEAPGKNPINIDALFYSSDSSDEMAPYHSKIKGLGLFKKEQDSPTDHNKGRKIADKAKKTETNKDKKPSNFEPGGSGWMKYYLPPKKSQNISMINLDHHLSFSLTSTSEPIARDGDGSKPKMAGKRYPSVSLDDSATEGNIEQTHTETSKARIHKHFKPDSGPAVIIGKNPEKEKTLHRMRFVGKGNLMKTAEEPAQGGSGRRKPVRGGNTARQFEQILNNMHPEEAKEVVKTVMSDIQEQAEKKYKKKKGKSDKNTN